MKQLAPYLMFAGDCREAMEFYKECLDGEITVMDTFGNAPIDFPDEASNMIFNSEVRAGNICIKASDNPGLTKGSPSETNFSLFVSFTEGAEFKEAFEKLSADGDVTMKNGEHFMMLKDKFGISWMLVLGE